MFDFVFDAFDLADKYRNPAMILADGALGQMMEKVVLKDYDIEAHKISKPWATVGKPPTRDRNIITSLFIQPEMMEKINLRLQDKYRVINEKEVRYELTSADDAEYLLVAYGLAARIAHLALELARAEGIAVGWLRPITLYPFPYKILGELSHRLKGVLDIELNAGQMVEDVRLGVEGRIPVEFYGRMGGVIPSAEEVLEALRSMTEKVKATSEARVHHHTGE
jgi:2-oxoglutarate ferredoxin oxidoreductase subunit alpha